MAHAHRMTVSWFVLCGTLALLVHLLGAIGVGASIVASLTTLVRLGAH